MSRPTTIRPLRPFERDCLELLELEGWEPVFSTVEDFESWIEIPYAKDGEDLFLLIAGLGTPKLEELSSLASKLDQRAFERLVYARERPLPPEITAELEKRGIELLLPDQVASRLGRLRQEQGRRSPDAPSLLRVRELVVRNFEAEDLLAYRESGEILLDEAKASARGLTDIDIAEINQEINDTLNLNHSWLRNKRREAVFQLVQGLNSQHRGTWTADILQAEINHQTAKKADGTLRPYHTAVVYWLKDRLRRT